MKVKMQCLNSFLKNIRKISANSYQYLTYRKKYSPKYPYLEAIVVAARMVDLPKQLIHLLRATAQKTRIKHN